MHLSMSSRGGRRQGIGQDFDRSLWPGARAFELSCCPGVGIFGFLFVPVTTNISRAVLTSHFCLGVGNLTAIQSNLDYPDLDYPDYSIIRTFFSGPNFFMNIN